MLVADGKTPSRAAVDALFSALVEATGRCRTEQYPTDQEGARHADVLLAVGFVDELGGVLRPKLVGRGDARDHQVLVQLQQRRILTQQSEGNRGRLYTTDSYIVTINTTKLQPNIPKTAFNHSHSVQYLINMIHRPL